MGQKGGEAIEVEQSQAFAFANGPIFVTPFQQITGVVPDSSFGPQPVLRVTCGVAEGPKQPDAFFERGHIEPVIAVSVEADGCRSANEIGAGLNTVRFERLFQPPERRTEAPSRAVFPLLRPEEFRQRFTRMGLLSIEHQPGQKWLKGSGQPRAVRAIRVKHPYGAEQLYAKQCHRRLRIDRRGAKRETSTSAVRETAPKGVQALAPHQAASWMSRLAR